MRRSLALLSTLLISLGLTGCEVVATIFELGFWLGVILVVVIIVVIWIIWQIFD